MPPPQTDWDKLMLQLEAEIRRLEAEFNMFFAGRLPRPPWEARARVSALMKKYDQSLIRNTGDRFRFESMQHRYSKLIELWDRQLTNRELGRPMPGTIRPAPGPSRLADPIDGAAPESGAVVRFATSSDPALEAARVQELFDRLTEAKRAVGEPPIPLDRLLALVTAQVEKFGADGSYVVFEIVTKDGRVSLTVKPEKG